MKDLSLGGCYPAQPSASMVNILLDLHNSSHPTQPHSIITNQTGYTHCAFAHWNFLVTTSKCDGYTRMFQINPPGVKHVNTEDKAKRVSI